MITNVQLTVAVDVIQALTALLRVTHTLTVTVLLMLRVTHPVLALTLALALALTLALTLAALAVDAVCRHLRRGAQQRECVAHAGHDHRDDGHHGRAASRADGRARCTRGVVCVVSELLRELRERGERDN